MKFSAKEDVEVPIDDVFAMISDFDAMERAALRRGVKYARNAPTPEPKVGLGWDVTFSFRGKARDAHLEVSEFDAPNQMRFDSSSGGLDADGGIELVALSRSRTRMTVSVEMEARTLSGRLLLQSLKLAKSNLSRRFKVRIADFAKGIEDRHNAKS